MDDLILLISNKYNFRFSVVRMQWQLGKTGYSTQTETIQFTPFDEQYTQIEFPSPLTKWMYVAAANCQGMHLQFYNQHKQPIYAVDYELGMIPYCVLITPINYRTVTQGLLGYVWEVCIKNAWGPFESRQLRVCSFMRNNQCIVHVLASTNIRALFQLAAFFDRATLYQSMLAIGRSIIPIRYIPLYWNATHFNGIKQRCHSQMSGSLVDWHNRFCIAQPLLPCKAPSFRSVDATLYYFLALAINPRTVKLMQDVEADMSPDTRADFDLGIVVFTNNSLASISITEWCRADRLYTDVDLTVSYTDVVPVVQRSSIYNELYIPANNNYSHLEPQRSMEADSIAYKNETAELQQQYYTDGETHTDNNKKKKKKNKKKVNADTLDKLHEQIQKLQLDIAQLQDAQDQTKCAICFEEGKCYMVQPCCHLVCCDNVKCRTACEESCPICKGRTEAVVKIYT